MMAQAEKDLGTRLDWIAVDHFNTGHPHAHVIVRGKDDKGKDLIIAREYISQGLRERAAELVNLDLGPRSELDLRRAQLREVEQERFTAIDRRLIHSADEASIVDPRHRNSVEQDLRTARLRKLARLGLAEEVGGGRWRLDPGMDSALKCMGERGDIIATLNRELKLAKLHRPAPDHSIYEPNGPAGPVVGRLVGRGLSDEHSDCRYLIVDGVDGLTHYVDIGQAEVEAAPGAILSVARRPVEQLAEHDGATWLDRELVSETPQRLERGFGAAVRSAQQRRLQWLVQQGFAEIEGDTVRYRDGMIDELERRDLRQMAAALSRQLGARFSEAAAGERIEGVYTRAVHVGDRKFALIQQSREFNLVPWRPVLERHIGREVSGIAHERGGISWTIGRSRGLEIS
jgi:hypothetical protein